MHYGQQRVSEKVSILPLKVERRNGKAQVCCTLSAFQKWPRYEQPSGTFGALHSLPARGSGISKPGAGEEMDRESQLCGRSPSLAFVLVWHTDYRPGSEILNAA
jgi:hypothetical protein